MLHHGVAPCEKNLGKKAIASAIGVTAMYSINTDNSSKKLYSIR